MNKEEFHIELEKNNLVKSRKSTVKDDITINNSIVNWEHRIIKNIVFEKRVLVENVDLICGLSFEYCEFKSGVVFSNTQVSKFDSNKFPINSSIYFHSCKITSLYIVNCEFYRALKIFTKTEIGNLTIENTKIGNGGINIKQSTVHEKLDLRHVKAESFTISGSIIESIVRLESVKTSSISLLNSTFNNWIKFWNIYNETRIVFNYNNFKEEVEISVSRIKGFFSHGDVFKRKLLIELNDEQSIISTLNEIYVTEIELGERFILDGNNKSIEKLTLPFTTGFKGVIKFTNCKVFETRLSGVNEHSKLIFKNINFNLLSIIDFTNFSDITFIKSRGIEESCFEVIDSDLGLTKFNDFSFESFNTLRIENSVFNKIICSNVQWFNDNQLESHSTNNLNTKFHKNKREIFRQFKQALKNNGNTIDSLAFQAKEMQSYRNELLKSGKYSLGDRLIMTVNRTNNYGLSWTKPTLIILGLTLIFYLFISILISTEFQFVFSCKSDDFTKTIDYFWENNKLFVQLLNPARKFSSVYGNDVSNSIYWIDIFHRIILSVFIFQIIKAFRKYVLK